MFCKNDITRAIVFFFFSSRRRHTRYWRDWSSDVCSSDLTDQPSVGSIESGPGSPGRYTVMVPPDVAPATSAAGPCRPASFVTPPWSRNDLSGVPLELVPLPPHAARANIAAPATSASGLTCLILEPLFCVHQARRGRPRWLDSGRPRRDEGGVGVPSRPAVARPGRAQAHRGR